MGYGVNKVGEGERIGFRGGLEWKEGEGVRVLSYRKGHHRMLLI